MIQNMLSKVINKKHNHFNKEREEFYSKYPNFYANYDDDTYQYGLYQTLFLDKTLEKEIEYATNSLWKVFMKVKDYLLTLSEKELIALNFPPELIKYISLDYLTYHSFISRMDFIVDLETNEVKCIELNNETPFYIIETFKMNDAYLKHINEPTQNELYLKNIQDSFKQTVIDASHYLKKNVNDLNICILGQREDEDFEEYQLLKFYEELFSPICPVNIVHFEDVHILKNEALYFNQEKIDVFFHPAYPLEYLKDDSSLLGEPIGLWMLDLVEDRKLFLVNSPTTHFVQNKTILALISTLANIKAPFLSKEDIDTIDKYLAKTYTSDFYFESEKKTYVEKPINGRRGISVKIKSNSTIIKKSNNNELSYEKMVYQEHYEMPIVETILNGEVHYKRLMISSYIVKNQYNGLVSIVGDEIIDTECHWLPNKIK